jgi:hypothetical protein
MIVIRRDNVTFKWRKKWPLAITAQNSRDKQCHHEHSSRFVRRDVLALASSIGVTQSFSCPWPNRLALS